jgi:hypothetical protein
MINVQKGLIISLIFASLLLFFSCKTDKKEVFQPTVQVKYREGRAILYRYGEPYFIRGAAGTQYMDKVAAYGGNSVRTWNLQDADSILDKAHELGLTVTLGLEIGRPHWGQDFNYWKLWEVDKKIEELKPLIQKHKDHPALLMWGVGNEVQNYGGGRPAVVYFIINRVANMIQEVDPNHPAMAVIDPPLKKHRLGLYRHIMPNIDVLGFNSFKNLNSTYSKIYGDDGWGKAYIFSEWGTYGHWEISRTEWGAPKESKDLEKRHIMEQSWNTMQNDSELFLGSYAFYWGYKHEATHTWFSLFSEEGHETSSVQFLKTAWSGQIAENLAPTITDMFIENTQLSKDNLYLNSDKEYTAFANAVDPEEDTLKYRWEIRHEENYVTGRNSSYNIDSLILSEQSDKIQFKAPKEEGPYRIFVFTFDGNGNVGSYNVPFYVIKR